MKLRDCLYLVLAGACGTPASDQVDTDSGSMMDTEPVVPQVDSNPEADTVDPIEADPNAITAPAPGMVLDRGSESWFRVLRQPIRCVFVGMVGPGRLSVLVVGVPSGEEHLLATGVPVPEDQTIELYRNILATTERHVVVAGNHLLRIRLNTANVDVVTPGIRTVVSHDHGFTVSGGPTGWLTYSTWADLVNNASGAAINLGGLPMGDGPFVYTLEGVPTEMVRRDPRTGEERRRLQIDPLMQDFAASSLAEIEVMDVVDGRHLVIFDRILPALWWYDLEDNSRRAVVPLSTASWRGMRCLAQDASGP